MPMCMHASPPAGRVAPQFTAAPCLLRRPGRHPPRSPVAAAYVGGLSGPDDQPSAGMQQSPKVRSLCLPLEGMCCPITGLQGRLAHWPRLPHWPRLAHWPRLLHESPTPPSTYGVRHATGGQRDLDAPDPRPQHGSQHGAGAAGRVGRDGAQLRRPLIVCRVGGGAAVGGRGSSQRGGQRLLRLPRRSGQRARQGVCWAARRRLGRQRARMPPAPLHTQKKPCTPTAMRATAPKTPSRHPQPLPSGKVAPDAALLLSSCIYMSVLVTACLMEPSALRSVVAYSAAVGPQAPRPVPCPVPALRPAPPPCSAFMLASWRCQRAAHLPPTRPKPPACKQQNAAPPAPCTLPCMPLTTAATAAGHPAVHAPVQAADRHQERHRGQRDCAGAHRWRPGGGRGACPPESPPPLGRGWSRCPARAFGQLPWGRCRRRRHALPPSQRVPAVGVAPGRRARRGCSACCPPRCWRLRA